MSEIAKIGRGLVVLVVFPTLIVGALCIPAVLAGAFIDRDWFGIVLGIETGLLFILLFAWLIGDDGPHP